MAWDERYITQQNLFLFLKVTTESFEKVTLLPFRKTGLIEGVGVEEIQLTNFSITDIYFTNHLDLLEHFTENSSREVVLQTRSMGNDVIFFL